MLLRKITLLCLLFSGILLRAQTPEIDSLKRNVQQGLGPAEQRKIALSRLIDSLYARGELDSAMVYSMKWLAFLPPSTDTVSQVDSITIVGLGNLGATYQFVDLDSAIQISRRALQAASHSNFPTGKALALRTLGENYRLNGELFQALEKLTEALRLSREINNQELISTSLVFIGATYSGLNEYQLGLDYLFEALALKDKFNFSPMYPFVLANIGYCYMKMGKLDSALYYTDGAAHLIESQQLKFSSLSSLNLTTQGQLQALLGQPAKAIDYFQRSIALKDYLNLGISQYSLAEVFRSVGQLDSALYYARLGYLNSQRSRQKTQVIDASRILVQLFKERRNADSALYYQSIGLAIRDSLFSPANFNKLKLAAVKEQQVYFKSLQEKEKAEQEKKALADRIKIYGLMMALGAFLLFALFLFRNIRQKQKANRLLQEQKDEAGWQREKAEAALQELKTTQAQLIQSEKMASLGELTAGIAHEIQNPLNFVNNFSELNNELIDETRAAISCGNLAEAGELLGSLQTNQEKINQHGRRAESIVKGMLQHSRAGNGTKEPTDLNQLADEYLRLSYHGYRANDKSFNASLVTDFDQSIGKVMLVSQDISRVLLNLCNNAFYAVHARARMGVDGYVPQVRVTTYRQDGKICISVQDNGPGIPDAIRQKIFQPFFTTKPTGQGTGLGLSLSYDIITRGNGGNLTVRSTVGGGAEFLIELPV
ncbi:ATP-binding protein [Flavihumibacter fluvii]|uniref:ATP-binding protein n=1 Tax=Flavihumibacter fluvii TaxID=2838157 RepID=UPI001BDF401C|nr:ATP-binding protein [Flavihumibacter fluvii]ULQ51944.1 ATP-binding protein [Flavihumibacter fluvii]